MTLEGKGFFTWKIPLCEGGDANAIAATAKRAGLSHVVIKVADGAMVYNGTWGATTDTTTAVISALRAQGIQIYGWHYIYGRDPLGEANVAIQRIHQYNLDGYVIDAEKEFKEDGMKLVARKFMSALRAAFPTMEIALSSYRFPSLHPQIPWSEFLDSCSFNMPQVYWMQAHNAGEQLVKCVREFQTRTPLRPIVPTGATFRQNNWQPTKEEVLEFMQTAKDLNLKAVNFWHWTDARANIMPGVWEVIRDYPWAGAPSPKDVCENFISTLNTADPEQVVRLYTSTAVHINNSRTIQGLENIRSYYRVLFSEVLPNVNFTLTGFSGTGNSRHLTWIATSSKGFVQNGNDTLGLLDGKINYHYSFFTVSH
ncbi:MAG: nuclear transport factor 2 family protein [Anaerolineales bacterium]|nr:nuclear transport factor 2 family protein [Anaerolineales bacterium]